MSPQLASVELLIVAHEAAHYAVAYSLGYSPRIRIRGRYCPRISVGFITPAEGLPRRHDIAIAASAPLLNLALCPVLLAVGLDLAAAASLILACCSLLPIPLQCQDGWRILQAVRRRR